MENSHFTDSIFLKKDSNIVKNNIREKSIMTERVKNAITLFVIAAVFLIISRVVFRFVVPFFFLFFLLGLICIVFGISILKGGKNKRD